MLQKQPGILRLKDVLWEGVAPLLPVKSGKGRKPENDRGCLEALLFLLRTGAQYSELPKEYPPKSTVHDAYKRWCQAGVWQRLLEILLTELDDTKGLCWEWLSADSSSVKSPLGGEATGKKSHRSRQAGLQKTFAHQR
jgi:putative transposase